MEKSQDFLSQVKDSLANNTFAKCNLGNYKGEVEGLKKIICKRVLIKGNEHLSFVYRYQTKDITKNYLIEEALSQLVNNIAPGKFGYAHLCTTAFDIKIQRTKKGAFLLKKEPPTIKEAPSLTHNKKKDRKIKTSGTNYLHALGISDADGNIKKTGQDKFRQINHYIEILSSLLNNLPKKEELNIVDMGSGKGYLTFALYDYLANNLSKNVALTGVEYRNDLVAFCNQIAVQSSFDKLNFVEGTIENYTPTSELDVLIALHACDTATDDAIYKGICNHASLIVVAPCCHKQIRKEIAKHKKSNALDDLTKHGIFMERQAEMVTDTLRALLLEQAGYATKIFEFIATEHTPKNVLIVAQKRKQPNTNPTEINTKIQNTKEFFGIQEHWLEKLLQN